MNKSMNHKEAFIRSKISFSSFLSKHGVRAKMVGSPEKHTPPEILMYIPTQGGTLIAQSLLVSLKNHCWGELLLPVGLRHILQETGRVGVESLT